MKIEYEELSTGPRPLEGIKIVEYGVFHAGPGGCHSPCNYPGLGKINIPAYPVHFSESSAGTQSRAPNIGEQTDEILDNLGYKADEIEKLKKGKVIY